MTLFYMDADERDWIRDELRAEAAAERRRLRPHWCRDCLGFTGPGSPCAPDEDEEEEDGCRNAPAQDEEDGDEQ